MLKIEELADITDDADALSDLLDQSPDGDSPDESLTPDPEPGYGGSALGGLLGSGDDTPKKSPRVTVATKKDIRAKVAMVLGIVGGTWSMRDPHCGGALMEAIVDRDDGPDGPVDGIATALTDLIVDSPDLVAWFTSSGRYLKWLTLAMSLQPVVSTLIAHHISHSINDDGGGAPDWSRYATD